MVKVIVLGLSGCGHCETLVNRLEEERIPFSFLDADKEGKLADKLEALLDPGGASKPPQSRRPTATCGP